MHSPEGFPQPAPAPSTIEDKPKRLYLDLASASQLVLNELEQENPQNFGPKWIHKKLPNVYAYFTRSMRAGLIKDWGEFTAQLPESWQERWSKESFEKWDFEKAKERLVQLLERDKPAQFNKKWIIRQDAKLYRYLNSQAGTGNPRPAIWADLIDSIGEWKDKWQEGALDSNIQKKAEAARKYTLESISSEVQALLEKEKPKEWSPTFLAKKARHVFRFAERNLTNAKGGIEWDRLISLLPPEYQASWKRKIFLEDITVAEGYSNQEEVDQLLEKHKDSLYLFYESTGKHEEDAVNQICMDFIDLIRKGNQEAKETFTQFLQPAITKWLDSEALPASLAQNPEKMNERVDRCLYLWKKNKTFLGYVFRTLDFTARGLKKHRVISLDEDREGISRHETIGRGDSFDDDDDIFFD